MAMLARLSANDNAKKKKKSKNVHFPPMALYLFSHLNFKIKIKIVRPLAESITPIVNHAYSLTNIGQGEGGQEDEI